LTLWLSRDSLLLGKARDKRDHDIPEWTGAVNPRLGQASPPDAVGFQDFEVLKGLKGTFAREPVQGHTREFSGRLREKGVLANGLDAAHMRMVTHFDVTRKDCELAVGVIEEMLSKAVA